MTIKHELERILQNEIDTMHKYMREGKPLDFTELTKTQQKLYELISSGTFIGSIQSEPIKSSVEKEISSKVELPKVKIIKRAPKTTKDSNLSKFEDKFKSIQVSVDDFENDPDVVAQGFFKQTIKGGYIKHLYIPEKLTRIYNLKHNDWAIIHGSETTYTKIEIIPTPTDAYNNENHPTTTRLEVFPYARVDVSETGERFISENLCGESLKEYTGQDKMVLSDKYPSHKLPKGTIVDLRYDRTHDNPDPKIVWVYDQKELVNKGLRVSPLKNTAQDWQATLQ